MSAATLSGCGQEGLIFFPETLPRDFRYSFAFPHEELFIPVEGAVLNALHFKTSQRKGVVLYFHGNAGSLRTWGEVSPVFVQRGYDVMIFDYRGFGKSTGRLRGEKDLLEDGMAIYDYVKTRYGEERIVVYGRSIGTGAAVWVSARNRPRTVVLESPYDSLIALAAHHYPFIPPFLLEIFLKYPLRTDVWIKDVSSPVVIFHGTRDDIIPFAASERLARDNPGRVHLIAVEGGDHNNLETFSAYGRELDRLLR